MQTYSEKRLLAIAGFVVLFLGAMLVSPPARAESTSIDVLPSFATAEEPRVRVKLSVPERPVHTFVSQADVRVTLGPREIVVPAGETIFISSRDGTLRLRTSSRLMRAKELLLTPVTNTPVTISSWNRIPAWDTKKVYNDNQFLGSLHLYPEAKNKLLVVNDIDVENYMRGVAEVPEQDETEKRKALAVVSRSYVAYYISGLEKKFDDARYNASDNPEIFQKYLGYGFTLRSPKWQEALVATKGLVLAYKGEVLRAAYSSCTDTTGLRKLPREIGWGGYFEKTKEVYAAVLDTQGVDPVRSEKNQCGHGVGLSGLGATNMAKEGKTYTDILNYYYKAITFASID
ncbi:hypothetical protein COW46_01465 [Candidatus Gracilibacteria bacterium CG17_big_fil_post_rev_8_21_14_2_50_48_13]|nr:MAG: hypothetical protein COW46_01465 [Candidatus Gracilibacteria bacterium CG17_big_fil_post_rev_8_21_14_2_50_48_13]